MKLETHETQASRSKNTIGNKKWYWEKKRKGNETKRKGKERKERKKKHRTEKKRSKIKKEKEKKGKNRKKQNTIKKNNERKKGRLQQRKEASPLSLGLNPSCFFSQCKSKLADLPIHSSHISHTHTYIYIIYNIYNYI